eukprot:1013672-Pleurochrysis_carterae.AAC.1
MDNAGLLLASYRNHRQLASKSCVSHELSHFIKEFATSWLKANGRKAAGDSPKVHAVRWLCWLAASRVDCNVVPTRTCHLNEAR